MNELSKEDRLQLMKFVCSFAWADLDVAKSERSIVHKLVKQLRLNADEAKQVDEWLKVPPPAEEVDPQLVPRAHRELFLKTIRSLIAADGEIAPDEAENYALFASLMK
jgi:uncharacterized tellurite resistance protein B-like protein